MKTELKLANGAEILDYHMDLATFSYIVLARRDTRMHPFVTWRASSGDDPYTLSCDHGHYYDKLTDAAQDFARRVEDLSGADL